MTKKEIEVEFRAEIKPSEIILIKRKLNKIGIVKSYTKRLSVMYFGVINSKDVDIRVRITNGEAELVIKYGGLGASDRLEVSQRIDKSQFIGFARIFFQFGFKSNIGERKTYNYKLPRGITVSLVLAKDIAYIELEKMSSLDTKKRSVIEIKEVAQLLGLRLFDSDESFNDLCRRLDKYVDWELSDAEEDWDRLKKVLDNY
jgi:hypothetical protein